MLADFLLVILRRYSKEGTPGYSEWHLTKRPRYIDFRFETNFIFPPVANQQNRAIFSGARQLLSLSVSICRSFSLFLLCFFIRFRKISPEDRWRFHAFPPAMRSNSFMNCERSITKNPFSVARSDHDSITELFQPLPRHDFIRESAAEFLFAV